MKQYSQDELTKIIELHKKWLVGDSDGVRANLSYANLSNADLSNADLYNANLSNANLYKAYLSYANLSNADLYKAYLSNANLSYANLSNADLYNADLSYANLSNANLSNANLYKAYLSYADLYNVRINFPITCPEVGSFIGWKTAGHKIVKLKITEAAQRSSATSRKCRCSEAEVLSIESEDGNELFETAVSDHDSSFVYKVGETVKVDDFDGNRWNECAPGIHFFITRQEAVDYM